MSSQKTRLYLICLILGAVALILDRFVFSGGATGPDVAVADETGHTPETSEATSADEQASEPIPELRFPRGLPPMDPSVPMRDLFLPPKLRRAARSEAENSQKAKSPKTRPDRLSRSEFKARHRAQAVIEESHLRMAVVDGLWMRIGQSLEGCRLTAASGNEVLFKCFDGEVTLHVIERETGRRD